MTAHHRTLIIQQELPEMLFGGFAPYGTDAMAGGDILNGDLVARGTASNMHKIGDLGPFPQI